MDVLHTLSGTVVEGDHLGRLLGFPTANLDVTIHNIPRGVYAGTVIRTKDDTVYRAGIVVGAQNTYKPPKVEAYLLDFSDNLYGEELIFAIKEYIREIRNYSSEDDLRQDIKKDIEYIRSLDL